MPEKKRKRSSHDAGHRPEKRAAIEQPPPATVKISVVPEEDEWAPIVANTPGLSFPPDISLKPYRRARKSHAPSTGKSLVSMSEHLLHTSAHPKIDYLGKEEERGGSDSLLNHYLGVYDPESGQLQLVRARKLVLRGSVRPALASVQNTPKQENGLSARNTLGLTFGTKKSQRAIESITKNAISPSKIRGQPTSSHNPIATSVLDSMAAKSSFMPTREELQASVDDSKPRPKPNLDAETPAEVYSIEQLVGPGKLAQMTIKEWQDAIEADEEILTTSRFVSRRVQAIVKSDDIRKLKTLKYLLLLVEWYNALRPGLKGVGRKVLAPEKLHEQLTGWSSSLIDSVSQRFTSGAGSRDVTRWHLDNLITHICALAITVDGFATNVYDLGQDLKLENKHTKKYYREIGTQVGPPTEGEIKKLGWVKKDVVARLRIPLTFPKMRVLDARKRR
ncbi:MAG: hypothetical protein LQ346_007945 [Caloplaca aetnensis]|nr:MAG: hypothetical protein LQ346_007945 [Caloplaca aetnensis]